MRRFLRLCAATGLLVASLSSCATTVAGHPVLAASAPLATPTVTPALAGPVTATSGSAASPSDSAVPSDTAAVPTMPGFPAGSSGGPTATATATGIPETADQASAALLTVGDVGGQFTQATFVPSTYPEPCDPPGTEPVDTRVPPWASVGAAFSHATPQAALDEQINIYADVDFAEHAVALGMAGMNCRSGTGYGTDGTTRPVTIGARLDMSKQLGVPVDQAIGWSVQSDQVQGSVLVVRTAAVVTVLVFLAAPGTDPRTLPDALAIARTALRKVVQG